MANKVFTGILVLLVIVTGSIGYYSYTINQQITDLRERLSTFETEQTVRIEALSNDLTTLRIENQNSFNAVGEKIGEATADIGVLQKDISGTQNEVAGLKEGVNTIGGRVKTLDDRLTAAVDEFAHAAIDAGEVYQKISQATVRISAGQNTAGSGVIFDADAHVVTAQHVIASLTQIFVTLHDGRVFRASVVGQDQFSDIAVLKLSGNPSIEPPIMGDSSKIRIGDPVVAVGSPFDLKDTLTAGIISQLNRYTSIQYDAQSRSVPNLLQFDAAVNPGNSGCPLANSRGEVIGIVVARINPDEGDGIYYAVAANKANRVAKAIIASGSFDYPWIGVGIANLTPQIVVDRDLDSGNGVLVTAIINNSPAEAAGVKVDDIIVSVDGVPVNDAGDITSYIGEYKSVGEKARVSLLRRTEKMDISVEIGKKQE